MPPTRADLDRIARLRDLFLDEQRGPTATPDYWRDEADLRAYDGVLGARIGWKWDAVLTECAARGFGRADADTVVDFGCGSGVAARRFVAKFGAREVQCHDRSRAAMAFATKSLRAEAPQVRANILPDVGDARPDVLLVSHVLAEMDEVGATLLRRLITRSQRVLIVEPGNRPASRRLSTLRDELRDDFHIVAPCTHAAACPALAKNSDWCHFFAAPPPTVFTNSDWVRTARELGIDSRSLPYSFLAMTRTAPPPFHATARLVGRPAVAAHTATVTACDGEGLRAVVIQKRSERATWRALKKHPESAQFLPFEPELRRPDGEDTQA